MDNGEIVKALNPRNKRKRDATEIIELDDDEEDEN